MKTVDHDAAQRGLSRVPRSSITSARSNVQDPRVGKRVAMKRGQTAPRKSSPTSSSGLATSYRVRTPDSGRTAALGYGHEYKYQPAMDRPDPSAHLDASLPAVVRALSLPSLCVLPSPQLSPFSSHLFPHRTRPRYRHCPAPDTRQSAAAGRFQSSTAPRGRRRGRDRATHEVRGRGSTGECLRAVLCGAAC